MSEDDMNHTFAINNSNINTHKTYINNIKEKQYSREAGTSTIMLRIMQI